MSKEDLSILEELINEAIVSYLDSGYNLTDGYVINLRNLLKKLDLKEVYNFDKRYARK